MKVLGRRGWITNLQIIFSAELQETLEARARMFRPLPFVAVWQEHRQARSLPPLVFRGGDVLIDDGLGAVYEVAKLRFPQHQRLARNDRVAILEAQARLLRKANCRKLRNALPGFASDRSSESGVHD